MGRNIIGVDLGGTFIKAALITEDGEILYNTKIPTTESIWSRDAVIANIVTAIEKVIAENPSTTPTVGIGIGTPGIVDNGYIAGGAENLPEWEKFSLKSAIESKIDLPVYVENDANLMGLAETTYGSAKGCSDAVFLTIGTGIGGAMIVNGELYSGYKSRGSELGHVIIYADGKPCSCGAKGCLETYASTSALIEEYKEILEVDNGAESISLEEINGEYIVAQYLAGEKAANIAMTRHFLYIGAGVAGFINTFSPQKVIIGGGISEAGEFYIDGISKKSKELAMDVAAINTEIVAATLGNKAGALGAAALVINNLA